MGSQDLSIMFVTIGSHYVHRRKKAPNEVLHWHRKHCPSYLHRMKPLSENAHATCHCQSRAVLKPQTDFWSFRRIVLNGKYSSAHQTRCCRLDENLREERRCRNLYRNKDPNGSKCQNVEKGEELSMLTLKQNVESKSLTR